MFKRGETKAEKRTAQGFDAVVLGAGIQGLAAAYYLAKSQGIKRVAVLEVSPEPEGRPEAALLRLWGRTKSSLSLCWDGLELWPALLADLRCEPMFRHCPGLSLAFTGHGWEILRRQAGILRFLGLEAELWDPGRCREEVPLLPRLEEIPLIGGLYFPTAGVLYRNPVQEALQTACQDLGVTFFHRVQVTGIQAQDGGIQGVQTTQGELQTARLLNVAGSQAADMAGRLNQSLPLYPYPVHHLQLQAIGRFLDYLLYFQDRSFCLGQGLEGSVYSSRFLSMADRISAWEAHLKTLSAAVPCLQKGAAEVIGEQTVWVTPDGAPILYGNDPVRGYFCGCGWGELDFQFAPVAGKYLAEFMSTGRCPEKLRPFHPDRFAHHLLLDESERALGPARIPAPQPQPPQAEPQT